MTPTYATAPAQPVHATYVHHPQYDLSITVSPTSSTAMACYQYSKSLRMFTGIDLFFALLNGLMYWPAIVSCVFPLAGYYGAHNYNFCCLYTYVAYLGVATVARGWMLFTADDWYVMWSVIFYILTLYVNYVVVCLTCRLRSQWRQLNDVERRELVDGLTITTPVTFVYY